MLSVLLYCSALSKIIPCGSSCFSDFSLRVYLQINMVGIALLAVVFAALYYYFKLADEGKE